MDEKVDDENCFVKVSLYENFLIQKNLANKICEV